LKLSIIQKLFFITTEKARDDVNLYLKIYFSGDKKYEKQ